MDLELEAYVARAQDPLLIPGIYEYCHHRCEQCPFTGRCFSFLEEQRDARDHSGLSLADHMSANLTRATAMMEAWCERHGINFEEIQRDAQSEAADPAQEGVDAIVDRDLMLEAALRYSREAYDIVDPLDKLSRFHAWAPAVGAAINTIAWYSGMIPAKVGRAFHGFADEDRLVDGDPVQNDWNGSAKVARLAIAESVAAWRALFAAGDTPTDASIRQTVALLESIDRDLAARFPLAMEFVRPGFDEPDIAAGALTKLAPFEPRHRTIRRRVQLWSSSVLRRLRRSIRSRARQANL